MPFQCLELGDSLYQNELGQLEVQLATDSGLEITGTGLNIVDEQRALQAKGFSAYSTVSNIQTLTSTYAVAQYGTELFDLGGVYDTSTYTFTAPRNGVYLFSHSAKIDSLGTGSGVEVGFSSLYKNGAILHESAWIGTSSDNASDPTVTCTAVVYLETDDTIQPYAKVTTGNVLIGGSAVLSYFSGSLILPG